MMYMVLMVLCGEIVLFDGNCIVWVFGEVLLFGVDNGFVFVVYVDLMKYVEF